MIELARSAFGAEVSKRDYSAQQRRDLEAKGEARPGGRFPIATAADVASASHLLGHASPADKAFIRRRARKFGAPVPPSLEQDVAKSAFGVALSKADSSDDDRLPGDNPQARAARQRKRTGLGVATVGYLTATRAKEMAPHIEDTANKAIPGTRKLDQAARAEKAGKRITRISRIGGRAGTVLTGAGLALAGEGVVDDLRYRGSYGRMRRKAQDAMVKSAFGVDLAKAYTPGEITYHDTQAQIHSHKRGSAKSRQRVGQGVITGGLTGSALGYHYAPQIARAAGRMADKTRTAFTRAARKTVNVRRAAVLGGAGAVAAGAGLAAEGALTAHHHRTAQTRELRAAQAARQRRNGAIGKSAFGVDLVKAFDPEERRHARQSLYSGAAAGGAVVAGGAAAQQARKARRLTVRAGASENAAHNKGVVVAERLKRMGMSGQPGSLIPNKAAMDTTLAAHTSSHRLAHEATKLRRAAGGARKGAVGAAIGAGALGASAFGIHRYDRRGGGRPYGY